jgi:hypothetical protein
VQPAEGGTHLSEVNVTIVVGIEALEDGGDNLLGCAQAELAQRLVELGKVDAPIAGVVELVEDIHHAQASLVQRCT